MKIAIKIFLLLAVVGYLVVALWKFCGQAEDRVCQGVRVEVMDSISDGFVTPDFVQSLLSRHDISPQGMKISDIRLEQIEQLLQEEPHIEHAICYYDAAGRLYIQVTPQQPVLHVISDRGEDYYLSSTGLTMPTAGFNVDLCVATGNISKRYAAERLLALARYVRSDSFWSEQIEQLHVVGPEEILLYPRVGNHVVELGSPEDFEDKLWRLRTFYREGLGRVGWNKYKTISLAYDGQVVCTKADPAKKKAAAAGR